MISEQAPTEKPKRKRAYKGKDLERRLAYQREYNRKLRAKEKAAQHRPLKPIEIAQLKRVPLHKVANEGSKEEMARFGQKWAAQTRDIEAYYAMLEQERLQAGNDWNEQSKPHFDKLMKG
jgi:hypothetical protein